MIYDLSWYKWCFLASGFFWAGKQQLLFPFFSMINPLCLLYMIYMCIILPVSFEMWSRSANLFGYMQQASAWPSDSHFGIGVIGSNGFLVTSREASLDLGEGKAWKYISLSIRGFPGFLATSKVWWVWCYSDAFVYLASLCTSCQPCFKVRDHFLPSVAPRAVETLETQDDKEWYAFQPCKSQEILRATRLSVYDIETYWDKKFPCWSKVSIVSSLEWEQTSTRSLCQASIGFLPYSGDVTNAKFPRLLCQQKTTTRKMKDGQRNPGIHPLWSRTSFGVVVPRISFPLRQWLAVFSMVD